MYKISKAFNFCYGHRVWNQELLCGFAESTVCKCRHLHGHECTVIISLSANELKGDMVTDFNNLGWFKTFANTYLDHKFIIDIHDPLFDTFFPDNQHVEIIKVGGMVVGRTASIEESLPNYTQELFGSFFIVDFVPTSENFSKWIYEIVQNKMRPINVNVDSIEWKESPKSSSTYYGESI